VLLIDPTVSGDVENPQHAAVRIKDRRGGAGKKVVGNGKMLRAVDDDRRLLHQCGADGICPAGLFGPDSARLEGNLAGFSDEFGVADRMEYRSVCVGQ
jgi:hypothetical protein